MSREQHVGRKWFQRLIDRSRGDLFAYKKTFSELLFFRCKKRVCGTREQNPRPKNSQSWHEISFPSRFTNQMTMDSEDKHAAPQGSDDNDNTPNLR